MTRPLLGRKFDAGAFVIWRGLVYWTSATAAFPNPGFVTRPADAPKMDKVSPLVASALALALGRLR